MEENIILEQLFAEKQYLENVIANLEKVEDINFPTKVPPTGYTFGEEILDVTTLEIEVNFLDKDLISNNYKLSLIKEYELDVDENIEENILEGYLLVPVELNGINNFYLKDLSVPVSLNLNLFGTNILELTSWGFKASDYFLKNGDTKTNVTIRYNLNNYFSDEINWTNLKLYTKDLTNNDNNFTELKTLTSLGGQEELELTALHVYSVQFTYDVVDEENILETKEIENLWILGTPLFNDCFSQGENYIKNYCSPIGKELEIFDKLTTIELEITGDVVIGTYSDSSTDNGFKEYYNNSNINFEITNVKEATINVSGLGLKIKNEYLYPEINLSNYTPNYSIEAASYSDSMNDYILRNYQSNENYTIDTNVFYTNNNTPKIRVTYKDFLKGIAAVTSTIKDVPYVFHNLSRDIVKEWPYTNEGGLEIRCPKIGGLHNDIQYVLVSLLIGNSDFDNHFYIDGFLVELDLLEKYFFNTSGSGHDNFQRWILHSTLLNDNHNIFMYRDNENDYYNDLNYTFAPVIYTSSTEEGTIPTDSREYGNCKFFLYTKTYSNKENLLVDDSIENSDLTWGIFKLEDCTYVQSLEMKRRKIINDIVNQFPQGSKICNKTKEDLEVYTILTATENPSTYYSYIKNVKLEKDLNVTGTLTLNNSPISIQQSFGLLTFKVKSLCDKTFHKEIATLNSNAKYFYLLDHLPTLNSYLDFDSGKYITDSTLGNNENIYNHVYVINNNLYKLVENVLVIRYKSNLDSLVPIFHRNEVENKYKYVIAQLPRNVEENHKTDYILNFELFNNTNITNSFGKNFLPYPISNLTVANS